ncbi:glycosyltransferase family 4 protein [Dolichospermum sp. UHCC 0259]|nr:glycosyltransferase family 4 protein [Dolichospermum sp. UHCC 0259]
MMKMKILLVSGVYPPKIGGPSAQTQQIARSLIVQGIDVHIITYGNPSASGIIEGIPITFIDESPRRGWLDKIVRNARIYDEIHRIIRDFQPTIVQMQTMSPNLAIMTGIFARCYRIPALIKYSSDLAWDIINKNEIIHISANNLRQQLYIFGLELLERVLFSVYDCIWATTPVYKDRLMQQFFIPENKILLLPNFIDLQRFQAIASSRRYSDCQQEVIESASHLKPIVLLTVTRLLPIKGIEICLEAVSHLLDLPVSLRIVGSGSPAYELSLQDMARNCGVSDRVEFVGAVSPTHIAGEYESADIFILASYREAFGIVLVEAMAAGLPIIASNVGGIPTVVENEVSAKLVPAGDALSLATAIRFLVVNGEERHAMAIAARTRAKAFDWDMGVDKLIETYKQLCLDQKINEL